MIDENKFDAQENSKEDAPLADIPVLLHREKSTTGMWVGIALGIAVAGLIGMQIVAPQFAGPGEVGEIPFIRRSNDPIKVRPNEPGGLEVPNRDKQIYGRIDAGVEEPAVERLLPPPEQPMEIPVAETEAAEEVVEKAIEVAENKAPVEVVVVEPKKPEPKVETKPTPKLEPPKAAEVKPAPVKTVTSTTSGEWKVQLVSLQEKPAVEKAWAAISQKHSEILSGIGYIIEEGDVKGKTYYRLKVGGYANRADADALCAKLKERKQGCFVAK